MAQPLEGHCCGPSGQGGLRGYGIAVHDERGVAGEHRFELGENQDLPSRLGPCDWEEAPAVEEVEEGRLAHQVQAEAAVAVDFLLDARVAERVRRWACRSGSGGFGDGGGSGDVWGTLDARNPLRTPLPRGGRVGGVDHQLVAVAVLASQRPTDAIERVGRHGEHVSRVGGEAGVRLVTKVGELAA